MLQHKINSKSKAMFGRLLRPTAWKRNGPTVDSQEVNEQGSK